MFSYEHYQKLHEGIGVNPQCSLENLVYDGFSVSGKRPSCSSTQPPMTKYFCHQDSTNLPIRSCWMPPSNVVSFNYILATGKYIN